MYSKSKVNEISSCEMEGKGKEDEVRADDELMSYDDVMESSSGSDNDSDSGSSTYS
jgi:hypothetical protein